MVLEHFFEVEWKKSNVIYSMVLIFLIEIHDKKDGSSNIKIVS